MSLSGLLEDVPLVDILQFVKLCRQSGRLKLCHRRQQAEVDLHQGNIVAARGPSGERLGELMVAQGAIDSEQLERALACQAQLDEKLPIGAILEHQGVVDRQQLLAAFQQQVRELVHELASWQQGRFWFEPQAIEPMDDISLSPSDLASVDLNMQQVMLDAARALDARGAGTPRPSAVQAPSALDGDPSLADPDESIVTAPRPPPAKTDDDPLLLQVVSADESLPDALATALLPEGGYVAATTVQQIIAGPSSCPTLAVLVDLRAWRATLDDLSAIRAARPQAPVLALSSGRLPLRAIYEAGATTVVDAEVDTIVACLRSAMAAREHSVVDRLFDDGLRAGFARLRRLIGEIRAGVARARGSLQQLDAVSDAVERAVFFLTRPHGLTAFGAFGASMDGSSLAELTRGLQLDDAAAGVLQLCAQDGQARSLEWGDPGLPDSLCERLGRPSGGRCAVFPVRSAERVIAVVYADNGHKDWPAEDIELVELAVAQVGMACENQQLRCRQTENG